MGVTSSVKHCIIRSAVATGSAQKCDYLPENRAKYNLDAIKIDPVIADLVGEEAPERVSEAKTLGQILGLKDEQVQDLLDDDLDFIDSVLNMDELSLSGVAVEGPALLGDQLSGGTSSVGGPAQLD